MGTRYFALIFGIIYLLVGIMGFIPALLTPAPAGSPALAVTTLYGLLLGMFAVNLVHTIVHLIVGLWGILAYRSFDAARTFSKVVAVVFLILFIMGLIPGANTMFGMAPLFGADAWLHLISAIVAGYFGFAPHREVGPANM